MPPALSEYDSDSSDDPLNTAFCFNPFLDTDNASDLVTKSDIDPLVYDHGLPNFLEMPSSQPPSSSSITPQHSTPLSSQEQPNGFSHLPENMHERGGWVAFKAPPKALNLIVATQIPPLQQAPVPALPSYQPSAKRNTSPSPSHEGGSLTNRPQRSTLDSNNVFDSSRTQDPAEGETRITPDFKPKSLDPTVAPLKILQQLASSPPPLQQVHIREMNPTTTIEAEVLSKRSQNSHVYLNYVTSNLPPREGPSKHKMPIIPSHDADGELQRPEGPTVVVDPRPPQYLNAFKPYPDLNTAARSTVIRSSSNGNKSSQSGKQRNQAGCPVSPGPTPPVQSSPFQSSSTHNHVFGLPAPYTQHQAECISARTPPLAVRPRTTRSGRHHVVQTIESSNIGSVLHYNSNARQHRRPGKRKRLQSPTSAILHRPKPLRGPRGQFVKRPHQSQIEHEGSPGAAPTRSPTPELILCIGEKVILDRQLEMLELITTSSKAALPPPEPAIMNENKDANITLRYSDNCRGLVREYLWETSQRSGSDEKLDPLSRSSHIQQLTIATDAAEIMSLHWLDISDLYALLMVEESCAKLQQACESFFDSYMRDIKRILSSSHFLPNLRQVAWLDGSTIHRALRLINRLPLQHVTLRGANMNEMLDNPDECNMQLISLDTDITSQSIIREEAFDEPDDSLNFFSSALVRCGTSTKTDAFDNSDNYNLQLVPFTADTKCDSAGGSKKRQYSLLCSIIFFAAPTLESLTWSNSSWSTDQVFPLSDWVGGVPSFSMLRFLKIHPSVKYDLAWLDVLIGVAGSGMIQHLEISIDSSDEAVHWFSQCGTLPYLTTWVLRFKGDGRFEELFLDANRHIQRLLVVDPIWPSFLEKRFFKDKAGKRFTNLTSLSIISKGASYPQWNRKGSWILSHNIIVEISQLHKLEQLWLSVGDQTQLKSRWLIDHDILLKHFHALQNLTILAFTRDTYSHLDPDYLNDSRNYYEAKHPSGEAKWWAQPGFMESEDWKERLEREWEGQHRMHILRVAGIYIGVLPRLEWIYIGQYPIRVVTNSSGSRVAVLESVERVSCEARLRKMFGER